MIRAQMIYQNTLNFLLDLLVLNSVLTRNWLKYQIINVIKPVTKKVTFLMTMEYVQILVRLAKKNLTINVGTLVRLPLKLMKMEENVSNTVILTN